MLSFNPFTAASYAKERLGGHGTVIGYGEGGNVVPLLTRVLSLDYDEHDAKGRYWFEVKRGKSTNELALAGKKKSRDAVLIKNVRDNATSGEEDFEKGRVGNTLFVFNPKNVRSIFAAFDPDNKYSTNLLASLTTGNKMNRTLNRISRKLCYKVLENLMFDVGQPVAVYRGMNSKGNHEFYAGVVKEVTEAETLVSMNFGGVETISNEDPNSLIPLSKKLESAKPLSKDMVSKVRLVSQKVGQDSWNNYPHIDLLFDFDDKTGAVLGGLREVADANNLDSIVQIPTHVLEGVANHLVTLIDKGNQSGGYLSMSLFGLKKNAHHASLLANLIREVKLGESTPVQAYNTLINSEVADLSKSEMMNQLKRL